MASTKKYFAGITGNRIVFRATASFTFRSLTFSKTGDWIGFSGRAGTIADVVELDKAAYQTLLAAKVARVAIALEAGKAANPEDKYKWGKGFGSSPLDSWVACNAVPADLLAQISKGA